MIMDVVLFNPAPRSGRLAHRRIELPLSLLSPASPLDRQGYKVRIIEGFCNPHWQTELRDALREKPLCFGVTSMTGPQTMPFTCPTSADMASMDSPLVIVLQMAESSPKTATAASAHRPHRAEFVRH